jgi:NADPH2 dehydrogenase
LTAADAVSFATALKQAGIDYVDKSSGGISTDARNPAAPGYNVEITATVRRDAALATRTVGLIVTPKQAEAIVADRKADMVALARAFLDDPHWAWHAARALHADVTRPNQYLRASPTMWAGAAMQD